MADPQQQQQTTNSGFDVDGARKAGYSDDEILQHLTSTRNFDVPGALKAGYSKADIIQHLSSKPAPITTNEGLAGVAGSGVDMHQVNRLTGSQDLLGENEKANLEKTVGSQLNDYYSNDPLGAYAMGSVSNTAQGVKDLSQGNIKKGIHETAKGVGTALLPTVLPAAVAAPIPTALALGSGYAVGKGGRAIAKAAGADEDTQNLVEDAGNLAGGIGAGAITKSVLSSPLAKDEAVFLLRKAFNPNHIDAPGFLKELDNQADTVLGHAKENGLAPSQFGVADSLAKTTKQAALADPYRKNFIDPFKDEAVSTGHLPGHEPMETIGQLDNRLHEINSTLQPKYVRGPNGSPQQIAAVDAQQSAALQKEAAGIRSTLANEISKRTGVPAKDIAAARKNYGELSDLADTMQQYADSQFAAKTAEENGPVSLSPFGKKTFVLDKAVNALRGDPVANALTKVLTRYEPNPPTPVTPSGAPPATPAPRIPFYARNPVSSSSVPEPIAAAVNTPASTEAPIVVNGKTVTVRAQRAAAQAAQARTNAANASATPPNAAGLVERVAPEPVPTNTNAVEGATIARPGLPSAPEPRGLLPNEIDRATPLPSTNPDLNIPREIPRNVQEGAVPNLVRNFIEGKEPFRGPMEKTPINIVPGDEPVGGILPSKIQTLLSQKPINFMRGPSEDVSSLRVNVYSPNGRYGHIPAAQVADALQQGYKLAEPLAQFRPNSAKPGKGAR